MKISQAITKFIEDNELDSSLEELFRKYEKFRAIAISENGGRPQKYFTEEEKLKARRARQKRYNDKKRLAKD